LHAFVIICFGGIATSCHTHHDDCVYIMNILNIIVDMNIVLILVAVD
jgi:hypothetical protein